MGASAEERVQGACFPALNNRFVFSRAWYWVHVYPRLIPDASFLALDNRFAFFPRLVPGACCPALNNRFALSRACYLVHVFSRLITGSRFPALCPGFMFLLRVLIKSLRSLRLIVSFIRKERLRKTKLEAFLCLRQGVGFAY